MPSTKSHRYEDDDSESVNDRLFDPLMDELDEVCEVALRILRRRLASRGINAVLIVHTFDALTGYSVFRAAKAGDSYALVSAARAWADQQMNFS